MNPFKNNPLKHKQIVEKKWTKTVCDLKLETESVFKNPKFKEIWNEKKIETRTRTSEINFTNRLWKMEERWSGIDYIIEEIDTSVKENGKSKKKNSLHKTLENIRQYETNSKKNRNR